MSNLTKRLITAGIGIPLLFLALFAYDGIAIPAVLLILVVLLLWECSALLQINSLASRVIYAGIGGATFFFVITLSREIFLMVFGQVLFFIVIVGLFVWFNSWVFIDDDTSDFKATGNESPQEFATNLKLISSASQMARIFVSVGCLVVLVALCVSLYGLNAYIGPWMLIYVLAVAWVTDTGAYFSVRAFGKKSLSKRISPNKTLEGAIGGYLSGLTIALIPGFLWFKPEVGLGDYAILFICIVMPITAIQGDLAESMFKRFSEAKESGTILPGHGGMLDRIDSLMFMAPFMFVVSVFFGNSTQ